MNFGRHVEVVFPGLRRFQPGGFQYVSPVINHLEVAIDHQQLGLAANLLAKLTEVGSDVGHVDLVIGGDIRV